MLGNALRYATFFAPLTLAVACGGETRTAESPMRPASLIAPAEARPRAPAISEPVRLGVRYSGPYGNHLVDQLGRSVYAFAGDQRGASSTCYDACARAWPPVMSAGMPHAASDQIKSAKFGTVRRRDGASQATYDGWPLYYFARDRLPGEAMGQGVHEFGADWYLIAPNGDLIDGQPQSPEEPATAEPRHDLPAKPDPTMPPVPMTDVPVPPDYPQAND